MSSTLTIWWHRNRSVIYIIPAVVFLVVAAILDKLYLSPDIQIPLITGLIVATFSMIVLSIPAIAYFARGDNYLEGHAPERDEAIDLPFHGGRIIETPLNYDPESPEDMRKVASGELTPRHDIPLYLTEPKEFNDLFPELSNLGIEQVTTIHLRYHLHFRDRFDLSTGAIVVRKGVPLYHPHADEVFFKPVGVDYYDGIPNPVFEVFFTRKGDDEMLSNPAVMDSAFSKWLEITKAKEKPRAKAPAQPPAEAPATQGAASA